MIAEITTEGDSLTIFDRHHRWNGHAVDFRMKYCHVLIEEKRYQSIIIWNVIPYNTLTVHCARFNVKINEKNGGHSSAGILYHVVLRSCDNIYGTNTYQSLIG